ncbi:MAG: alpha/beta fold hydrolase [Segniliparus sp.]|uniref:alpha/beta fold hydrolase n=1 Tax=Segniliparus sp. TaxID=2804064 RepID=UPI003F386D54
MGLAWKWCVGILVVALCVSGCDRQSLPQKPVFHPQPVSWGACDGNLSFDGELGSAWSATEKGREDFHRRFTIAFSVVRVPVDYDRPEGEKIGLTLVRVRSRKAHDSLGPLLISPGGPGDSGLWEAGFAAWAAPEQVSERFDYIGFDQRGVGCSGQVSCWERGAQRRIDLPADLREPGAVGEAAKVWRAVNERCARQLGARLGHYSTYEAAQDMESIRVALGAERITYLGYSYGAFLGAVYAHLHPRSLRAAVLDSPIDNTRPMTEFWEETARARDEGFSEFLDWAGQRKELGLPVDARTRLADLADRGARLGLRVPAFYDKLNLRSHWPQLVKDLRDLLGQTTDPQPAQWYEPDVVGESRHVIGCDDQAPGSRLDEGKAAEFAEAWPERYPLLGTNVLNWNQPALLECAGWPEPAHPATPGMMDATGSPPILVVSGLHDPNTAHRLAGPFTTALRTGFLLSTEHPGHAQYLNQEKADGCLNTAVEDYLVAGKLPAPGTTCPADE